MQGVKMTAIPITQQIISYLDDLSPAQQIQVLELVRSLVPLKGRPGNEILELAGTIAPADLEIMRQVADELRQQKAHASTRPTIQVAAREE
jgi:hypothetical protein